MNTFYQLIIRLYVENISDAVLWIFMHLDEKDYLSKLIFFWWWSWAKFTAESWGEGSRGSLKVFNNQRFVLLFLGGGIPPWNSAHGADWEWFKTIHSIVLTIRNLWNELFSFSQGKGRSIIRRCDISSYVILWVKLIVLYVIIYF